MSNPDEQYSVGVVGLGAIGAGYDADLPDRYVLTHARAASMNTSTQLIWGVDPDSNRRARFENLYKAVAHSSLDEIDGQQSPDILIVATPPASRLQDLSRLLELRPKVLIIEKPLGESAEASQTVIKLLRQSSVPTVVNYTRRFCAGALAAKKQIESGALGVFRSGVVRYKDGVRRNGSHLINLVAYVLGTGVEVKEVGSISNRDEHGDADVFFHLSIASGEVLFSPVAVEAYSFGDVDLLFENGRVRFEDHAFKAAVSTGIHDLSSSGFSELNDAVQIDCDCADRYQDAVLSEIVRRIDSNVGFASELDDAETTENICNAVLQ